jgi:hypothetical protein
VETIPPPRALLLNIQCRNRKKFRFIGRKVALEQDFPGHAAVGNVDGEEGNHV